MRKIIRLLKNRVIISVFGLFFVLLIIWFGGPLIKFGEENTAPLADQFNRLLAILVVVVLWGLNNLRTQLQNNKNNSELMDALREAPKVESVDLASEQSSDELNQINERFSQALNTLKKVKFSGGGRRQALYELPWYIIIGPPGAGKTTALTNSSLEFPLDNQFGKSALQGVGGTRNCDWWFTNDAVLIDTAGRYTTQDSNRVADSSAWEGFLSLLRKKRRRRPINGAIISISVQDLMTQTESERAQQAKIIRTRIDELMEKLGVRFPIYVLFTKSDLIAGFSEFFEDLSREEREQVWGITLPNMPDPSQSPDFELLGVEYQNLVKRLYERTLPRVHQERDVRRRGAIQSFPQQVESLVPSLQDFIRQVFVKNRYQFQPYLRGSYFCSGTQDGTPIDRLMTSVAAGFGISRASVQGMPHSQGKSFFLGNVFRDVVFPESELVGSNRQYERLMRWSKRGAYAGLTAIIVGALVAWGGSYTRHEMHMNDVAAYVSEFNAEETRVGTHSSDLSRVLPALNALGKASIVYDQEKNPWLTGLGLYDSSVDQSANSAYQAQLQKLFLPGVLNYLENYLKKGHEGGDLYNTFRTYLMFSKLEHMDKRMVTDWFEATWEREFKGQATKRKELQAHLAALLETELLPAELDKRLVTSVRSLLLRVPVAQRIYGRIRTNPQYIYNIDMLNQFGESVRSSFKIDSDVMDALATPYLFTYEGYENIDISPESGIVETIVNDRWVLSDDDSARVDFIKDDLDEVSEQVKEHYLAEYKQHWDKLYDSLEIAPFQDIKQAHDVLANIVDPVYSPMLSILKVGADNTQLTNALFANLAEDHQRGKVGKVSSIVAENTDWTIVDRQFRNLNELLREKKDRPAAINQVNQKVIQLREFVNEIILAPDPSKKAFDIAKARYMTGSGNPVTSLRAYAKTTPQPINRWLDSLSDETWKVILQSARQHVNSEWRAQVYKPYQKALAGRYPLKQTSIDELATADFSEFFKPQGTIDKFYSDYLSAFIDTRRWKNKTVDGRSLGLSTRLFTQLKKAREIKSIFFRDGAETPSLSFQLRPSSMSKQDARFIFELGDQRISYNHGPKLWKTMRWVGNDEYNRVRVIFEDVDGETHSQSYEGSWAWFRLQSDHSTKKTARTNIYKVEYSAPDSRNADAERRITYEIKANSVNNPFGKDFLGSFRCPESI